MKTAQIASTRISKRCVAIDLFSSCVRQCNIPLQVEGLLECMTITTAQCNITVFRRQRHLTCMSSPKVVYLKVSRLTLMIGQCPFALLFECSALCVGRKVFAFRRVKSGKKIHIFET